MLAGGVGSTTSIQTGNRNYRMDNVRCVLIFLVVLGHLLDLSGHPRLVQLNELIYSFHMPAFVFLTGCFAKFSPRKAVLSYLYPYCLMQVLYVLLYRLYMGQDQPFQFSLPHYTLWYLLASAFYFVLIPLLQTKRGGVRIAMFAVSVAVALAAGFDPHIEYRFTISRFLCFLPYFVAGYFWGHGTSEADPCARLGRRGRIGLAAFAAVLLIAFETVILKSSRISLTALYHAGPYTASGTTWLHRLFLLLVGFTWVAFFLLAAPNRKFPVFTKLGQNTLAIYLFHGFLVKIIGNLGILPQNAVPRLALSLAIAAVIVLLFGNRIATAAAKWCLTGHWIGVLLDKRSKKKCIE